MSAIHSKTERGAKEEELEFKFKLPKQGLAIQGVQLKDGIPIINFQPSPNVPTITEQDVAAACRLTYCDQTRPKFIFVPIPPGHPFCGRQYKYYSPQWMKGTGFGELLFEADWIMKCLMIGARSSKDKTVFDAWENSSNLQGLASVWDFYDKEGPTDYTVYMSCSEVTVCKTSDELMFPKEPKIRIDVDNNPRYTDYITAHYDTVGHYDEPLLLKIREVPKLILIAEWLKKKGVPISTEWMMANTQPKKSSTRALAQNSNLQKPTMEKTAVYVQDALKAMQQSHGLLEEACTATVAWQDFGLRISTDTVVSISDIKVTDKHQLEWDETRRRPSPFPWMPPLDIKRRVKASYDDFDRLYEGMDPKQPLGRDKHGLLRPPVQTWQELYHETVPWPHSWQMPYVGLGKPAAGGGVNMTTFATQREPAASKKPVPTAEKVNVPISTRVAETKQHKKKATQRASQYRADGKKLGVQATPKSTRQPSREPSLHQIPSNATVERPSDDVRVSTPLRQVNEKLQEAGAHRMQGTHDYRTGGVQVHTKGGRRVAETHPLRIRAQDRITMQGQMVAEGTVVDAIPVPEDLQQPNSPSNTPSNRPVLSLSLPNKGTEQQAQMSPNTNGLFSPTGSQDSGYIGSPPNEPEPSDMDPNEDSDPAMNLDECSDADDK